MRNEQQFALLIDAENISPRYIKILLNEISKYGVTTYRRIYSDWTNTRNNAWKGELLKHSITPIQQYTYTEGKNASDSAMIIDAMDILYSQDLDGFVLVSSDSDFTRLASRLRESGKTVIGMGESKTPRAFIAACNTVKYLDILYNEYNEEKEADEVESTTSQSSKVSAPSGISKDRPQPQTKLSTICRALKAIILENSEDDSWISLANLGNQLSKRFPDFDVRNYGHKKLGTFIDSLRDFEIEARAVSADGKTKHLYVRTK